MTTAVKDASPGYAPEPDFGPIGIDGYVRDPLVTRTRPLETRPLPGLGLVGRHSAGPCRVCGRDRRYFADEAGTWLTSPLCGPCGWLGRCRAAGGRPLTDATAQTDLDLRRARLEYPGLAALGLIAEPAAVPIDAGAFPVGAVTASAWRVPCVGAPGSFVEVVDDPAWRALLERHRGGDFGDVGRLADAAPNADAAWAPELAADELTRNAIAVGAGDGIVRSVYPLPAGCAARLKPGSGAFVLTAETLLGAGGGGPSTFLGHLRA